ncbi:hypothetical protein QBC32DRAFT_317140 [Pseudoneurospora amorphoporcata]|uniref:Uncharacterized protein n=1 Tax=Pseudoneurospora amorphoporcata TaxID=241081 RepID=A0AAN6NQF4_9PEZI|nr:hypothetical protein QBC32DRAFT_317140 [Pseudoneurospora amorphoporcata]
MSDYTARKLVDLSESDEIGYGMKEKLTPNKLFTGNDLKLSKPQTRQEAKDDFLGYFNNGKFVSHWTWSGRDGLMDFGIAIPLTTATSSVCASRISDSCRPVSQRPVRMGVPDLPIRTNNFAGDELRLIFKAWAESLGGFVTDHWGGVDLGLVTPINTEVDHPEREPLSPAIEVPEKSKPGLPILLPDIVNRG